MLSVQGLLKFLTNFVDQTEVEQLKYRKYGIRNNRCKL